MHGRASSRGHRPGHSYSASTGQKAQLNNAYSELGNALLSTQIKTVGNYTLGRIIGEGSFGKVRLAVHKLTSQRCAIKQIPRSAAPPLLTREIHHHRRLHHPHVLRLFEVIATEGSIWLVSELCAGGELFDYLVEKGRLGEMEARRMFGQLCLGLAHVHAQGVVHRDLKLENVLLDERCNVKIADFGFGREFEQRRLMETYCGTTGYAAPEMLAGKKYTGEEVDIWSMGVILYTLLTGSLPFDDDDEEVMKGKVLAGDYDLPSWLSEDSRDLISGILRQEPRDRLSIRQILEHSWFTRPYTFSPPSIDYFGTFDTLPHSIPEESGSPLHDEPEQRPDPVHQADPSTATSEASTSSWHSAASTSDSDAANRHGSRSGTPLTADESDQAHSDINGKGKGRGMDDSAQFSRHFHRNESQTTITKSDSLLSLSRHPSSSGASLPAHSPAQAYRFPPPSPMVLDNLPHGSPALPIPAHSRTPSRTKRRSVGSTISERMLPKEEGPALPDYISLLTAPIPLPFSTPSEKHLLEALSLIGLDTGQMMHSVHTDACDAAGAVWWMLKLRADQREADLQDAVSVAPQKSDSMTSLAHSLGQMTTASQSGNTPQSVSSRTMGISDGEELLRSSMEERAAPAMIVTSEKHPTPSPGDRQELLEYGGPSHTPSPRKPKILTPSAGRMSSVSAPALSPGMRTKRSNSPPPKMPIFAQGQDGSPSKPDEQSTTSVAQDALKAIKPQTKPRSASVSTVSMLQRAGSVLGVSVSGKKDKLEELSADSRPSTADAGRSTPSLLGASLFGRKASSGTPSSEKSTTPREEIDPRVSSTDSPIRTQAQAVEASRDTSVPSRTPMASPARLPIDGHRDSPDGHSTPAMNRNSVLSSSHGSAGESPSLNSLRSSTISAKSSPRASKNLFSSFRQWFNDDRRKSKRQRQSVGPGSLEGASMSRSSSGTLRRTAVHAPSPLQRPPIARMPSNTPSSAVVSRRNSSTSARRIHPTDTSSPLFNHTRRRSDASRHSATSANGTRTPVSDKGERGRDSESRPPSSQSSMPVPPELYTAHRKRHGRASSTSSNGSRNSAMLAGSPVATYRRTPAVTQVKRISTPKSDKHRLPHSQSHSHSRNPSNPTSVQDSDSRRSSHSLNQDGEETIMEDDNENAEEHVEDERFRTLRKLAGDSQAAPALGLDEMGGDAPRPSQERRTSSDSQRRARHYSSSSVKSDHHRPPTLSQTVFAAHKVVNPFGTPNGSHFQAHSNPHSHHHRKSIEGGRPKIRDVFKNQNADGEADWIDEDEGLSRYTGGFGQASLKVATSNEGQSYGLGVSTPIRNQAIAAPASTPPPAMFAENRYAGLGVQRDESAPSVVNAGWKGTQGARGPSFRRAATVVEEEEEEEE